MCVSLKSIYCTIIVFVCAALWTLVCPMYPIQHTAFLISMWSIAGCCDAVHGEPCRSRETVTFQRTGITLLTLLLWLEFSLGSPQRWPHLVPHCTGMLEVIQNLLLSSFLFLADVVNLWNILCYKYISFQGLFFEITSFCFLLLFSLFLYMLLNLMYSNAILSRLCVIRCSASVGLLLFFVWNYAEGLVWVCGPQYIHI